MHCFKSEDYLRGENLRSGDDGVGAHFSPLRRRFWKIWTSGVVLVELVLQLQGLEHCSGTFFLVSSSFLAVCIRHVIRALL